MNSITLQNALPVYLVCVGKRSSRNVAGSAGASQACRDLAASGAHEHCPSVHPRSAVDIRCPAVTAASPTAVQHPALKSFRPSEAPSPPATTPPTCQSY